MRTIHDVTLTISPGMPVWPGDPPVVLEQVESMDRGGHANVSKLGCSVHTGTHVDAPHHFLNDGRTVEGLDLEILTGPAEVVRIPDPVRLVTGDVLEQAGIRAGTRRLLLKTSNSKFWQEGSGRFQKEFTAISPDGAEWLIQAGIELVGVDYLSVAPFGQGTPTHRLLLGQGIILVEGLDLSHVEVGVYDLYCLPLKIAGSDGAPARVILVG
jgi:arylformamidase